MPVPQPRKGESQSDYMGRCMHEVSKNKDRTNEQNVAICMSTWRAAKGQKQPKKKALEAPALFRAARIDSGAINPDKRTVSFSFSSRHPVRRKLWDKSFKEVLSHDPGAIDTGRLDSGLVPLLWNHDWNNQIGVIRTYAIQDGKGMAIAEMSPNQNGVEALRDIQAGIKSAVSVGYIPRVIRCLRKRGVWLDPNDENLCRIDPDDDFSPEDFDDEDDEDDDDEDDDDLYEIARWEPIEVSLVSVPADPNVGVGRSSPLYEVRMLDAPDEVISDAKVNLEVDKQTNAMPEPIGLNPNVTYTGAILPQSVEIKKEEVDRIREAELTRIREIQGFGVQFKCVDDAETFIRSGKTVAQFQDFLIRQKLPQTEPVTTMNDPNMGFGPKDVRRYSITRALRNKMRAQEGIGRFDGFEAEVSAEIARQTGQHPSGFFMPEWALTRDLTVTPPGPPGGGVTVQTTVEPSLIPLLRNRTAVLQAGARYISGLQGNLSMPRQNAPSTISWNTEIAAVTESDLHLEAITLSPNRVGGWCNYSKQLLAQSSLDIDNVVRDDMIQVIQIAIDAAAINGTGTNQPTGILNTAANAGPPTPPYNYSQTAPVITFPSGYPTWTNVVNFEGYVEVGNLILDETACYITTPSVKAAWKTYAKSDPRQTTSFFPAFYWESDDEVNGYRAIATNQVPANKVIFGKWNELMIGQWAGLDIVVDLYTLATQAEVRVITNMFVDIKYRYASAFCYSTNSGVSN